MTTDIIQLFSDYNIQSKTEGHKHCRPGWVNTECPFCISEAGHEGLHLGATLDGKIFFCWRCGWHSPSSSIAKLLKISETEAKKLLKQYVGLSYKTKDAIVKINSKTHKHPSNTGPLEERHIKYLLKRGFDPEQLQHDWDILGTGPISKLDKINYSNRILAPIYWDGKEVTFQARSISDKSSMRYLACPEDREIIKHKHIIYGRQDMWKDTIICVEGITDVWRFGFNAICTFGIKYTNYQVRLIASTFKRVIVIFDDERQAQDQADNLVADLKFRGLDSWKEKVIGDPGGMNQKEANYLVKQLIK